MRNLFLILDGHNLSYRSHFALARLAVSQEGFNHALLGFVRSFRALERSVGPTHHVAVFDGGLSEERLRLCPEYKAQRPRMPDALRAQMPLIEEYLQTAAVPLVRKDGVEADDIMATLARRAAADGATVLIASSDKDLCQLIGEHIRVVSFSNVAEILDEEGTARKFGVPPERLTEYLALTGDASDNIEGVPGIGPVTASCLLRDYPSLGEIYARLSEIGNPKIRQALTEHRARVERNLEMIRLATDLEDLPTWGALQVREPMEDQLSAFFQRVRLPSLAKPLRQPDLFDGTT